jgi:hypothetical protein
MAQQTHFTHLTHLRAFDDKAICHSGKLRGIERKLFI